MKSLFLVLIIILFIIPACRSSARFSTSKSNEDVDIAQDRQTDQESSPLNSLVNKWINTPYKYGGMNKSGVDCSGFSTIVMLEVYDIKIPRTARDQYSAGEKIRDGWRVPGDLVFFKNFRGHGIDHVGIYLGNNRFAHASESKGVIVSDLDETYYRKRYVGTCRYKK